MSDGSHVELTVDEKSNTYSIDSNFLAVDRLASCVKACHVNADAEPSPLYSASFRVIAEVPI